MDKKNLAEDLLNVLKEYAEADDQYINPNFLSSLTELIYDYYELESGEVIDKWVTEMWGY